MDNFLSASDLIIARLQDKLTLIKSERIRPAMSERWVVKNALSDSVSVIFYDDTPLVQDSGQIMRGKNQRSEQFWLIILSVRNVADSGNAARQDVGLTAIEVLQALQGWKPSLEHGELHRKPAPFRITDDGNGFVHISFLFSTQVITKGLGNG